MGTPRHIYYRAADADWGGEQETAALDRLGEKSAAAIKAGLLDNVQVVHVAINTLGQRGYPLLTPALDWTQALRKFMETRATITDASARYAFKKTVKGGPSSVNALASAMRNATPAPGGAADPGYDRMGPVAGATMIRRTVGSIPSSSSSTPARGTPRPTRWMLKLEFLAGVGISEHYFGDATKGNLATATAMERPVELTLAEYQETFLAGLEAVAREVLEATGKPEEGLEATAPPILNVDVPAMLAAYGGLVTAVPEMNQEFLWRKILSALGSPGYRCGHRAD